MDFASPKESGRFGLLADLFTNISRMSAFEQERTFRMLEIHCFEGPLSAKSGN